MAKNLYIIAGCNGAGKTTASFTVLPEILDCDEYVNADEIARGISPFKPERVAIQAGRIMLLRIRELLAAGVSFALETTLATKSYQNLIKEAKSEGYTVTILFFYLESVALAIDRVSIRVKEGGHNIPVDVIERRYYSGIQNFFSVYQNLVDVWQFYDNSGLSPELLAYYENEEINIFNNAKWESLYEKHR